ncbi:GNAT family N-acetyltransferase [Falsiroseomonas bella]|uniref:GNAT family N-acetyltransferase n=1 Tax=Falsiroseomonas bella TaxID=2184016 RepID=A0A317FDF3_9PROT|nr:GNAT family N-acetyltransferase [Falsiroseomonas bella]PWS35576.1 GNAT family N-acetyltransferase [Falsiroseomonas bella]
MRDQEEGVRPVVTGDLPALRAVIAATGLFPAEMLEGMAAPFLAGEAEEVWLTAAGGAAVAYVAPERMTQGSWNLLLIAVHPGHQRRGLGAALVAAVEAEVIARGGRLLLVETSSLPDFDGTRAFYRRQGYEQEARIRDFYQAGEDKVVFRKLLRAD